MKRILIIEDDPIISRVYSSKYQSAGFETRTAADGQEGLDLLRVFKPDLVHLDLTIPKVNGAEIIKHIRSHIDTMSLPVVVLSNTYQNRLVKAAIDAGASECVSKATCTPKMMLEIVEKYRSAATLLPPPSPTLASAPPVPNPPSSAVQTPQPTASPANDTAQIQRHSAFHDEIARGFLGRAPKKLAEIRELVAPLFGALGAPHGPDLTELCRTTESFAGQAALGGFEKVSHAAYALAALLREVLDHPAALTSSCLHTIVAASELLPVLIERAAATTPHPPPSPVVLTVDDDKLCRTAVSLAMSRLQIPTIGVEDPRAALRLLSDNHFSLIFVDVEMPGMSGFEFCRAVRSLPQYGTVPLAFVSALADEGARKQAMESGGNDLIGKPFLPMELAVKALTLLH